MTEGELANLNQVLKKITENKIIFYLKKIITS